MAIGPVAEKVSASFDRYWNSESAYPAIVLRGKTPTIQEIKKKRGELEEFVKKQNDSEYIQARRNSYLAQEIMERNAELEWGEAEVVYDQPEKILHEFEETKFHIFWF